MLSAFVIGFAFAFGWTPCLGPILTVILGFTSQEDTLVKGILLLAVYYLGLAVPFLLRSLLAVVFRGKFLDALERAYNKHRLTLAGQLTVLQSPPEFRALPRTAAQRNWVVYAKRPFVGPAQVLTYLSRYTHRIAIANSRLRAMNHGKVTFRWRDYAHGHQTRTMTLPADEFLRRFLLHVLPISFVRIRYFGLLANRHRAQLLNLGRSHLQANPPPSVSRWAGALCQHCHRGIMRIIEKLSPAQISAWLQPSTRELFMTATHSVLTELTFRFSVGGIRVHNPLITLDVIRNDLVILQRDRQLPGQADQRLRIR